MNTEEAMAERNFRQNPPESAPGQSVAGSDDWGNMAIGSSSAEGGNVSDTYQSNINATLNASGAAGVPSAPNQGMNPIQSYTATEDKVFAIAGSIIKGTWSFFKAMVSAFQEYTHSDYHKLGVIIVKYGVVTFILGIIGSLWEMFMQRGNRPINLILGGLLSLAAGIALCMMFDLDKSEDEIEIIDDPDENPGSSDFSTDNSDDWSSADFGSADFEDEPDFSDSASDDDWSIFDDGDFGDEGFDISNEGTVNSDSFDPETEANNLSNITPGTQTRQYLFEAFMKVLPLVTPDYSEMKDISADCDEFYLFENYLRSAAEQVGTKEENIPELLSLKENPFIYRLNCNRPVGMKEQLIADEIANTYSRDENNMQVKYGTYATVETRTGMCSINVFKGFEKDILGKQIGGVSISLGDVYRQIQQFVCSPQVQFPFVWGVNELGQALYCDMKANNSIIISGVPRGGKSWKGQSIVAQLAMFHSPKELWFYVLDNKNDASDYRQPSEALPHVKYFCGDVNKINDSLEQIIDMMVNIHGKKITDAGYINIADYNKDHPNDKMPYVYVVIDELQALMDYFTTSGLKDEAARFRGYLSAMTSKLPYTGLRFVLFPHRIVDQIIPKNTYSLVSCRVVVNQLDAKQVEASVGITEAKFGHKLPQVGDMAVKIPELNGGEPCFCHAEMLSSSNTNNKKLFEYIGSVWKKLEPDCKTIKIHGSIGGRIIQPEILESIEGYKQQVEALKTYEEREEERRSRPAPDNTKGYKTYEYTGFDGESSVDSDNIDMGLSDLGSWDDMSGNDVGEDDFWEPQDL